MVDTVDNDMQIKRCVSCDGYGWFTDEFTGQDEDCDWCGGTGYVYRDANGVDHKIPRADWGKVADIIENLETRRMRDLGYSGEAKHPDEQAIRLDNNDDDLLE